MIRLVGARWAALPESVHRPSLASRWRALRAPAQQPRARASMTRPMHRCSGPRPLARQNRGDAQEASDLNTDAWAES
eukprot:10841898-Alexandrium_andersonii.AAC.1